MQTVQVLHYTAAYIVHVHTYCSSSAHGTQEGDCNSQVGSLMCRYPNAGKHFGMYTDTDMHSNPDTVCTVPTYTQLQREFIIHSTPNLCRLHLICVSYDRVTCEEPANGARLLHGGEEDCQGHEFGGVQNEQALQQGGQRGLLC